MSHVFTSKYGLGDTVYLRVATEPMRGMVTAIQFVVSDAPRLCVSWGNRSETWHFPVELSTEFVPDFVRDAESKA